jgi:hypothetical protein
MARFVRSFPFSHIRSFNTEATLVAKACLALFVLLAPSLAVGQFTGAYVDASSPIFTANYGGDMCKAINNAYLSLGLSSTALGGAGTASLGFFSGTIDARGFTGVQACKTPPFQQANIPVQLLLNCNVVIVTQVGWLTPQLPHEINGCAAGRVLPSPITDVGAILQACGPSAPGWSLGSLACNVPVEGFPASVSVARIVPNLTFNVHHGPYPSSIAPGLNYTCMICDGAQGDPNFIPAYNGWDLDAFGSHIYNLRLDAGGNSNIFGLYTLNEEELSEWKYIQCGGWQNGTLSTVSAQNRACWFIDRTEASTRAPGCVGSCGGQSGPGNFVVDQITLGSGSTNSNTPVGDYGGIYEGSDITLEFTGGCTIEPVAFVTALVPSGSGGGLTPSGVRFQSLGSSCSSGPTITATYPFSTGTFTSGVWSNAPVSGGAHLTIGVTGGHVDPTTLSITAAGVFPVGFVGGMKSISNMTFTGAASSGTTLPINGGLLGDGAATQRIDSIHCEKMTGDCLAVGTFAYQPGGQFSNLNSNVDVAGATVHLGVGIDNGQVVVNSTAFPLTSTKTILQDDANLVSGSPLTLTIGASGNCSHGVSLYMPASVTSCNGGMYMPELGSALVPSGLTGFDAIYGKASMHWPAFLPSGGIEQLFAGLAGTWTSGNLVKFGSSTTGALADTLIPFGNVNVLSSIVAAVGSNTINNVNSPQTWNWAQTTNSQSGMTFGEASAATNGTLTGGFANQAETTISTASGSTATPLSISQTAVNATNTFGVPAFQIQTTWNNSSLTDLGILFNVTNTASATGSLLMDLQANGIVQLSADTAGNVSSGSTFQGVGSTQNEQFCGGQCLASSSSSLEGGAIIRGGDSSNSSGKGGYAILRGGLITNSTPTTSAVPGLPEVVSSYANSTVAAIGYVLSELAATQFTVTDCSHTGPAHNILGIATSTTNPITVVTHGEVPVNADATHTVHIGDILCMGTTTDGLATSSLTAPCTTPNDTIGIVIATSGSITVTVASGTGTTTVTLSTSTPLVQLR